MKVALVHDWLTNFAGGERVLYELHRMFPDAPIYTSVFDKSALPQFDDAEVRTTWLQKMPFLKFKHQLWTPLRPRAFRSLDLSKFDLVISSSSAEAKQVRVRKGATHICYCHTPTRYFWVNPDYYKQNPGLGPLNFLAPLVMPIFINSLKKSDFKAAKRVDYFVANSNEVKSRIEKSYGRESVVINPPVEVERFRTESHHKRSGFVIISRQIPYKRIDLAIKACNELKLPLTVIGTGPEHENLKSIAGDTITFTGFVSDEEVPDYFHKAEAFIFPSDEDFGIAPVEAMAAGLPVIAFGKGGILDSVVDGETGVLFERQTVDSLKKAIAKYQSTKFDRAKISKHAERFNIERFRLEMTEFINSVR